MISKWYEIKFKKVLIHWIEYFLCQVLPVLNVTLKNIIFITTILSFRNHMHTQTHTQSHTNATDRHMQFDVGHEKIKGHILERKFIFLCVTWCNRLKLVHVHAINYELLNALFCIRCSIYLETFCTKSGAM